jgi:hypothetical protein
MNQWDLEEALAAGFTVKQVLYKATIMHTGWESDNEAWLVELEDGSRVVLTTNHGSVVEMSLDYVNKKLQETTNSIGSIRTLLASWPKE